MFITCWKIKNAKINMNKLVMPFLCGGYTQEDWDTLNGKYVDREYMDDYLSSPSERAGYLTWATKPAWCY